MLLSFVLVSTVEQLSTVFCFSATTWQSHFAFTYRNSPEKAPGTPSGLTPPDKVGPKVLPKQQLAPKFPEGSFTVSKVVRRPPIKPATVHRAGSGPPERPPGRPLSKPSVGRGEKVARAPMRPTPPNRAGDKVGARLGASTYSNGVSDMVGW